MCGQEGQAVIELRSSRDNIQEHGKDDSPKHLVNGAIDHMLIHISDSTILSQNRYSILDDECSLVDISELV